MRFMIIVKATKESEAGVMPDQKLLADMGRFNEELVKAGVMQAGEGLQPSSKGARMKFAKDGKRTVVDGPFAETKELVAGFWIWKVKSRAEALEWFDVGYLVETYRQLGLIYEHEMRPAHGRWTSLVPDELAALDGYTLVQKAAALAPEARAELEFAAALMSREPLTAAHLRRAASSAPAESLLARNLAHYDVR